MAADSQAFKAGMRRLAASVTILTVGFPDGRRFGITATAVCSVCVEPPTLLCCVNRSGSAHAAFAASDSFAINVLAAADCEIAARFASARQEDRFTSGHWKTSSLGPPILESAIASFACQRTHMADVGTHSVIFGIAEAVSLRGEHVPPLLYAHGGYGHFVGTSGGTVTDALWMPDWRASPEIIG